MSAFNGRRGYVNLDKCSVAELLAYLIPARSFYSVLESITAVCEKRSRECLDRAANPGRDDRGLEGMLREEAKFFTDAAKRITKVRTSLDDKWGDSAPPAAHGDQQLAERQVTSALMSGFASW